jgi:3-hydroxyacyl-[acyl-carrier-protein] dehydratase
MRWIWIDRFVEFEPGKRAVAVKNVTLAEEHLHDFCPARPTMPASLMIEGMAQTAGILVGQARDFKEKVVLAKIRRASFERAVWPGEQLKYEARVEQVDDAAAITSGVVWAGQERIGQVDLVFSHADQNMRGLKLPEENFVFTEQFMSLFRSFTAEQDVRGG